MERHPALFITCSEATEAVDTGEPSCLVAAHFGAGPTICPDLGPHLHTVHGAAVFRNVETVEI